MRSDTVKLPTPTHIGQEIRISNTEDNSRFEPKRQVYVDYGSGLTVIPVGASATWVAEVISNSIWPYVGWVPR